MEGAVLPLADPREKEPQMNAAPRGHPHYRNRLSATGGPPEL